MTDKKISAEYIAKNGAALIGKYLGMREKCEAGVRAYEPDAMWAVMEDAAARSYAVGDGAAWVLPARFTAGSLMREISTPIPPRGTSPC